MLTTKYKQKLIHLHKRTIKHCCLKISTVVQMYFNVQTKWKPFSNRQVQHNSWITIYFIVILQVTLFCLTTRQLQLVLKLWLKTTFTLTMFQEHLLAVSEFKTTVEIRKFLGNKEKQHPWFECSSEAFLPKCMHIMRLTFVTKEVISRAHSGHMPWWL